MLNLAKRWTLLRMKLRYLQKQREKIYTLEDRMYLESQTISEVLFRLAAINLNVDIYNKNKLPWQRTMLEFKVNYSLLKNTSPKPPVDNPFI